MMRNISASLLFPRWKLDSESANRKPTLVVWSKTGVASGARYSAIKGCTFAGNGRESYYVGNQW
jgi:hypothetical protein